MEARRASCGPCFAREDGVQLREPVCDRAGRRLPRDRRSSRRQLHGLSRQQTLRAAAVHPPGGSLSGPPQDLPSICRRSVPEPGSRWEQRQDEPGFHDVGGSGLADRCARQRRSHCAHVQWVGPGRQGRVGRQERRWSRSAGRRIHGGHERRDGEWSRPPGHGDGRARHGAPEAGERRDLPRSLQPQRRWARG